MCQKATKGHPRKRKEDTKNEQRKYSILIHFGFLRILLHIQQTQHTKELPRDASCKSFIN